MKRICLFQKIDSTLKLFKMYFPKSVSLIVLLSVLTGAVLAQSPSFQKEISCGVGASTPAGQNKIPQGYLPICTDPSQIKYLRVAIHFLLPGEIVKVNDLIDCGTNQKFNYIGAGNFTETGDGFTNSGYNGYKRAEDIIGAANGELQNNADQWRKANDPNVQNPPANVNYPTTPPQIPVRYLLTGVYFHRNKAAYEGTMSDADIHSLYGVNKSNTINIYYQPSKEGGSGSGMANSIGGSEKYIFNYDYYVYVKPHCRDWSLTLSAQLFNHEIGHTLSLRHTWNGFDNCADTPLGFVYDKWAKNNMGIYVCTLSQNANCWAFDASIPTCPTSSGEKPCDTWPKISNNMMDYNQNFPHAVTTCQVERMNSDLAVDGNMFIHSCNGCMPSNAFFEISGTYKICSEMPLGSGYFLNGSASFNENKWLIDVCEVDPANPSVCLGSNTNTGWQNGQVGKVNLRNYFTFQVNKSYRIKLIVDKTDCPLSSEYSRIIQTKPCNDGTFTNDVVDFAATNPFNDQITVYYNVKEQGNLGFRLINVFSGQINNLLLATDSQVGDYQLEYNTATLPSGTYSLQAIYNGFVQSKNLVKP